MSASSEVNAINRQKFLAELAKLLTFMYEEDRRYALDMYERMFDIAEGNEQWLIQNLMSPTRQAVIIARSYDAKERKLSVSAEWKEEGEADQSGETPPFVLAINKIFDDLFPDDEESEEAEESDTDQVSFFEQNETDQKETKKHRMPKAAVLLNKTQEFESVTAETVEGLDLESILKEEGQEDFWTGQTDTDTDPDVESEPDPRVQIVDRAEIYESAEGESAAGTGEASLGAETDPETPSQHEPEAAEQHDDPQPESGTVAEAKQKARAAEASTAEASAKLESEKLKAEKVLAEAKILELRKTDFETLARDLADWKADLEERERALAPEKTIADLSWAGGMEDTIIDADGNVKKQEKKVYDPEKDATLPPGARRLFREERLAAEAAATNAAAVRDSLVAKLESLRDRALAEGRVIDAEFYSGSIESLYPDMKTGKEDSK